MVFNWLKGNKTKPASLDTKHHREGASLLGASDKPDGLIENAVALATGLEMVDAFYPGHDPIEYYGNGGFRFGSMSHQGALMFLPTGIRRWDATSMDTLTIDSFDRLLEEKDDIEIILIGTGERLSFLDRAIADSIRAEGIKVDVMDTGAAVRTLNILLSEDRAVAAALLPVG